MVERSFSCAGNHHCTLVVPTYNAGQFIASTVDRLRRFVSQHPDWCVLFVCDGCSDSTVPQLQAALRDGPAAIDLEVVPRNRGKGHALRLGLNRVVTPYAAYTDVDLAYDPEDAVRMVKVLEGGADLAVANRVDPASRFLISPCDFPSIYRRHRLSRIFNWWLRQMLPIEILDTQAGLKAITTAAWRRISPHITTDGFFFDVELLAWAGAMKMAIAQTPVTFRYVDPTTVRMIRHGRGMALETLRLRRTLKRVPAPVAMALAPTVAGE